jgi:hypothetical protein
MESVWALAVEDLCGSREILWDSDVWLVRIQIGTGPNVGETRSLNIPRDRGLSADVG